MFKIVQNEKILLRHSASNLSIVSDSDDIKLIYILSSLKFLIVSMIV